MTRPISPESLHEASYTAGEELAELIEWERAVAFTARTRLRELAALLKSDENSDQMAEMIRLVEALP